MDPEEAKRIAAALSASRSLAKSRPAAAPAAPARQPLSFKDVASAPIKFGQGVRGVTESLIRGTLRSGASIGTELTRAVNDTGSFEIGDNATRLERALATELYGSRTLPTFQSEGDSFLDVFGAPDDVKQKFGYGAGAVLGGLDVFSGGTGSKGLRYAPKLLNELSKVISRTKSEEEIFKTLASGTQRIPTERLASAAKELAAIDDAKAAKTYLQNLIKTENGTAFSYKPAEVAKRLERMESTAADLVSKADPKYTNEARVLADNIAATRRFATESGADVSTANRLLANAEDTIQSLIDVSRKTSDEVANIVDDSINSKVVPGGFDGAELGFIKNADGTFSFDPKKLVAPITEAKAIEKATTAETTTRLLQDVAEGRLPVPPTTDELIAQLPEEATQFIESNPGFVPVRGIQAASIEDARAAYLSNIADGHEFDTVAFRSPTGEIVGESADGGKFFSEDVIKQALLDGKKELGFVNTVRESKTTLPEVAQQVRGFYDPITNTDTLTSAREILLKGDDEAVAYVKNAAAPTAETNAVAQLLIEKFQREGKLAGAVDLVEYVAAQSKSQGQAIQSLSMWNRLTPAGLLKYADKTLNQAGKKLTPELAEKIVKQSQKVGMMEAGWEKSFETAKMLKFIADEIPVSLGKKISLIQTTMLLLNPKTWIRNLVGNGGFSALEQVSDVAAAGLDSAMSLVTGVRTKVPPSILEQSKGAIKGAREGWKEAIEGVNTIGAKTQFDIPQGGTFKKGVGKALETALNVSLRVPDRMFYQAAHDGSLWNQLKAENITRAKKGLEPLLEATDDMKEIAIHDALYRTFQDDSSVAQFFSGMKKLLNKAGIEDFGLGDILIKFPKTPGNLLARGLEYSPVGFMNTIFEASKPLMGKKFDQKKFVEAFARATTGSAALVGTGALLGQLGIITGKSDDANDVQSAKKSNGLGEYRINASALKRFVLSGGDPSVAKNKKGDNLVSYDWLQPAAMPIAIGANISENKGLNATSALGQVADAVLKGADTLTGQPVLQNLLKFTSDIEYYGLVGAAGRSATTLPASFVPTLLYQVRQLLDNDARNTYDPDVFKYAMNLVKNRIPGLDQTLPKRSDAFGNDQEMYQNGTNNLFNVLFNPAFINKYKDDPAISQTLSLYNQTGERDVVPDLKKNKQTVNGKEIQLGPKTYYKLQKFSGERTRFFLNSLAQDPEFQKLPAEQRSNYIAATLRDINTLSKIVVLGDRPKTVSARVQAMLEQER